MLCLLNKMLGLVSFASDNQQRPDLGGLESTQTFRTDNIRLHPEFRFAQVCEN